MTLDPGPLDAGAPSYSTRPRERTRDVVANRAGVTGSLFAAAMGLSWLLGRSRT